MTGKSTAVEAGWRKYLGCIIGGAAYVIILIGYLVSAAHGLIATIFCTPLLIAAMVVSSKAAHREETKTAGNAGIVISAIGFSVFWLFASFVMFASFLMGLSLMSPEELGPLSLLNWG